MFFIISKLLNFLIKPLVWILFGMLKAVLSKNEKSKRRWLFRSLFLLWFFSNTFIFEAVMKRWEPKSTQQPNIVYDYGIVLGGMSFYNENLNQISFVRASDRLWQAIDSYHKGEIKKIIITGGSGSILHHESQYEGNYLKTFLIQSGIPEEDVLSEAKSKNTRENAVFTKEILKENLEKKSLLFTSAFHMRRAKACFEKVGISVDTHITDSYVNRPRNFFGRLLIPNEEAISGWTYLTKELVGYVAYKFAGYL